mgnify:CR=1 FL=1
MNQKQQKNGDELNNEIKRKNDSKGLVNAIKTFVFFFLSFFFASIFGLKKRITIRRFSQ